MARGGNCDANSESERLPTARPGDTSTTVTVTPGDGCRRRARDPGRAGPSRRFGLGPPNRRRSLSRNLTQTRRLGIRPGSWAASWVESLLITWSLQVMCQYVVAETWRRWWRPGSRVPGLESLRIRQLWVIRVFHDCMDPSQSQRLESRDSSFKFARPPCWICSTVTVELRLSDRGDSLPQCCSQWLSRACQEETQAASDSRADSESFESCRPPNLNSG